VVRAVAHSRTVLYQKSDQQTAQGGNQNSGEGQPSCVNDLGSRVRRYQQSLIETANAVDEADGEQCDDRTQQRCHDRKDHHAIEHAAGLDGGFVYS